MLLAFGLLIPSAALADANHQVTLIGNENEVMATFTKAKCVIESSGTGKSIFIKSKSVNGEYILDAAILHDFSAFTEYPVMQGPGQEPDILVEAIHPNDATEWGSQFKPPFPVPGAGAINFANAKGKPGTGQLVGIGFGPAMWSRDFSSAVVLAGVLECQYPGKRKHH